MMRISYNLTKRTTKKLNNLTFFIQASITSLIFETICQKNNNYEKID